MCCVQACKAVVPYGHRFRPSPSPAQSHLPVPPSRVRAAGDGPTPTAIARGEGCALSGPPERAQRHLNLTFWLLGCVWRARAVHGGLRCARIARQPRALQPSHPSTHPSNHRNAPSARPRPCTPLRARLLCPPPFWRPIATPEKSPPSDPPPLEQAPDPAQPSPAPACLPQELARTAELDPVRTRASPARRSRLLARAHAPAHRPPRCCCLAARRARRPFARLPPETARSAGLPQAPTRTAAPQPARPRAPPAHRRRLRCCATRPAADRRRSAAASQPDARASRLLVCRCGRRHAQAQCELRAP